MTTRGARVATADFNGDTHLDVILSVSGSGGRLVTFFRNGQGGFGDRQVVANGSDFREVVTVNVNGDAHVDFLVLNATTNAVVLFLGHGGGTFQPQDNFVPTVRPITLATVDLNGDGRFDVLVLNGSSGLVADASLSIFLGNADGSFARLAGIIGRPRPRGGVVGGRDGVAGHVAVQRATAVFPPRVPVRLNSEIGTVDDADSADHEELAGKCTFTRAE
jgi:FG-GAP-like repeat